MNRELLEKFSAPDFDLRLTLASGQVFNWHAHEPGFVGMIGDAPAYVQQQGDELLVTAGMRECVRRYFALDHPLAEICAALPDDPAMNAARDFCRGLRIIRQPRWECLASFITSSMKQVAHIRQMSEALRRRFGRPDSFSDLELHSFPSAERIAAATEAELRACGLGYRAKNLLGTARAVSSGTVDLDAIAALPDGELRAKLCELPGVGPKVANCVLLFAYERRRAFPIDVWIERALKKSYFPRRRKFRPNELRDFAARYFGEEGGYAQQYLFHHARSRGRRVAQP